MAEEKKIPTAPQGDPGKRPDPPAWMNAAPVSEEEKNTIEESILKQPDPAKWLRQPPKVMRGDMKEAFRIGAEAEKYKCNCWNRKCPFFGNCRKCIAFHMALKQIPTCQREMICELLVEDILPDEMYVREACEAKRKAKAEQA